MRSFSIQQVAGLLAAVLTVPAHAQPKHDRPAEGIQDNSFLIEEAYNQEPGVVQHIFNARWSVNRNGGGDDRA